MTELYLITGSAGFIGYHVARRLLLQGARVIGVDCLSDYYSVDLKKSRNAELLSFPSYQFIQKDLNEPGFLETLLAKEAYTAVLHFAAQPGVRLSMQKPELYIKNNIEATQRLLEAIRKQTNPSSLYIASSSSVYGNQKKTPFLEEVNTDHPISFYGVTKKSIEVMASTYSHLYGIKTCSMRFFTVYGPWGRPDMAPFQFTERVMRGEKIILFNQGEMLRDFTYIDDVVESILRLHAVRSKNPVPLNDVYNIGCSHPRSLRDFVQAIEKATGKKAQIELAAIQEGDAIQTYADVSKLRKETGYSPQTQLEEGMQKFVEWYRQWKK